MKTKAQFINSLPADMPADDVVKAGKDAGVKFSRGYVYVARASARKAEQPKSRTARLPDDVLAQFDRLALRIGLDRVEQRLEKLRAGLEIV